MVFRSVIQAYVLCWFLSVSFWANAASITVDEITLDSINSVNKNKFDFIYSVTVTNDGSGLSSATATVETVNQKKGPKLELIDDSLTFGPIASGGQGVSIDRFIIRQDNSSPPDTRSLIFKFTGVPVSGNNKPIADAGNDQTVAVDGLATLDGTGSFDSDGNPLSFQWSFVDIPADSQSSLFNADEPRPSFKVDKSGQYTIQLVVNDGQINSDPDQVVISTKNSAPVANAGDDFTALVKKSVLLNGTASSDVDGDTLAFKWSIVSRPDGSTVELSEPNTPQPSLLIDYPGNYVIQLIVNDGFADSPPDNVMITTENSKPVADAGADQTVFVTDLVKLDGSNSSDVDLDALTYQWSISAKPAQSSATLSNPASERPSIKIDYPGNYVIQLIVNDGKADSLADTVVITTQNSRPVANAGADDVAVVGVKLKLNGSQSLDADFDSLDYQWSVIAKPDAGNPVLVNENTSTPEFTADIPGTYILQLIVYDGSLPSEPDTVVVEVAPPSVKIQSSSISGIVPLDVTFNAVPNGGFSPYQFEWDLDDDGIVDDTRKNFVHSFLQRGDYKVTLKMTDSKGYQTVATQVISAHSAPLVVAAAAPDSGSAPLSVTFSASATDADGTIDRYDWDFDGDGVVDQSSASSAEATHVYQKTGLYNAKLTVYDNDGLFNNDTVAISVGVSPQVIAKADIFTGVAPLVVNFSGSVTDSDGQVVLYQWDFDGDKQTDYSSSTSPNLSHTYTKGGVFNATLKVFDNDGLIDEDSIIISVSGPPTSLPGAFPLSGEAPLTVTFFSDGKDLDGGPEYYDWDFNGDGTFDQRLIASQNTTFTYTQPGTYQAVLKVVDDDGLAASASITITVNEGTGVPPGIPTAFAKASPSLGSTPLDVFLFGSGIDADGNIVKYEWDFESDGSYDFSEQDTGIQLISEAIDVGSFARPAFADFDGDGDLDMMLGNSNGQINLFRNEGNSSLFGYINQGPIEDGGGIILDIGSYAAPYAFDIDGDNDFDLIVGDSNGWVYVLENTGTALSPSWENNGPLKIAGGGNLDIGSYATPVVYPLGNDGDWDLLVGNSAGFIAVIENTGSNSLPVWSYNGDLQDSTGALIDVGSYASPWVIDHDGNGVADIYVGEINGEIIHLENQGDDQNPVWVNQGFIADASGNIIDAGSYAAPAVVPTSGPDSMDLWLGNSNGQLSWYRSDVGNPFKWELKSSIYNNIDVGNYAAPASVDYDDNGILDLVVGNSSGNLQLIRNIGTLDRPIYKLDDLLIDNLGATIGVGNYSSPAFYDLDSDGDDDMIVGNSIGQFVFYKNTGSPDTPEWGLQGTVTNSAGSILDIGSYSSPSFFDLDDDGDQDILAGDSGGQLHVIKNSGTSASPVWDVEGILSDVNGAVIDVGSYAKPLITDLNADGTLDLLVGTSAGVVYRYENVSDSLPYRWLLKETQVGKASVGSYAAPVAVNLDGDIDEDLMIGNALGLIYQLSSLGNVKHVYTAEGLHTANFRATDNKGNTAVDQVSINVLPSGYPSLTLQASVSEGFAPLNVNFVATANDNDGSVMSYEWDFDGDGVYELTGSAHESYTYTKIGVFSPHVRVIDNDGKQVTMSAHLKVRMQIDFSHNAVINPGEGETSSISTVLDSEATITLLVVDEFGNVIKTLVDGEFRTPGTYVDSWDGFDSLNNQVSEGAYYFVIRYSHNGVEGEIDARSGFDYIEYTPSRTWPSAFNPFTGVPVTSTYTVNKPSEVSFYFWVRNNSRPGSTIAPVRTLFIRELKAAGSYTEVWDGVDDNGVPVKPGEQYPITLWVYELPPNAIVITGSKPVIKNLNVTNRVFNPSFNPFASESIQTARVQFEITADAAMDVVVIDGMGLQIDRFNKPDLTAGTNSISWDGHNFKEELVPPGVYSIQLTAIDNKGNRSLPRYAIVTVRY